MSLFLVCNPGFNPFCFFCYFTFVWYGITIPIYITVLVTLIKFRKDEDLKHAFFKFMISMGVADIIQAFNTVFLHRAAYLFGWYHQFYLGIGAPIQRFYGIVSQATRMAQITSCLLIACNRLTAFYMPIKHASIWRDSRVFAVIVLKWTFGLITTVPQFFAGVEIHDPDPNGTEHQIYLWYSYVSDTYILVAIGSLINFTLVPSILALYVAILAKAFFGRGQTQQSGGVNAHRAAVKLALCGFLISSFLFAEIAISIWSRLMWFLFKSDIYMLVILFSGYNSDFFCGSNPYLLLLMSTLVRKKYLEMYGCKKVEVQPVSGGTARTGASRKRENTSKAVSKAGPSRNSSRAVQQESRF